MSKIKIGIVNYLNTKPLLYGIEHSPVKENIELVPDYPANIAALLIDNKIDAGLVPVAVIPRLRESYIITDYCIGAEGPVASVCLLSDVPLNEIKTVLIDYQSRTSANLVKILIKNYWKLDVELVDTKADFRHLIKDSTAGLVIGDRCLEYREKVQYAFDLAEAWRAFTGLPFVFAAWISNKALPVDFIQSFNAANRSGIEHIEQVAKQHPFASYDSLTYFSKNISYDLTNEKRKGLQLFLQLLSEMNS